MEGIAGDAQHSRGTTLIAVGSLDGSSNGPLYQGAKVQGDVPERFAESTARGLSLQPALDILGTHGVLVCWQHRAKELGEILELPHVSRKGVTAKQVQRLAPHVQPRCAVAPMTLEEMLEEKWDVFAPFSQRWDFDDHDRKPVEQILPKGARPQLSEAAVRSSDDPNVDGPVLHAADRPDFAPLQDAQQFRLGGFRELADLVEQERASLREHKQAGMIGECAGEGTAPVAEQLAFNEVVGQRRAVDWNEGPAPTRPVRVDRSGEQLLPGSRLTEDQDWRRAE